MSVSDVRQKVFRVPGGIVLSVGLCWDFIGADPVDLDLSAVCFTKAGQFVDVVFFNHLFPQNTDEAALRGSYLVDPSQLPYLFLSGDSTIGGEEENQKPGATLAARRRRYQMQGGDSKYYCYGGTGYDTAAVPRQLSGRALVSAAAASDSLFNKLYEEEELADVQGALDWAYHLRRRREASYDGNGGANEDSATGDGDDMDDIADLLPNRAVHRELCDEVLTFVMPKIPKETDVIFVCVTSYTGVDFTVLPRVRLILYNETTNERVGSLDLRTTTGSGTANLACMLLRVPPPPRPVVATGSATNANVDGGDVEAMTALEYWDLREMNIRAFGYTFVDLLPLMLRLLGVPPASRPDALRLLPNYSLMKPRIPFGASNTGGRLGAPEDVLSDVRFGLGWCGPHDLDAFLVMLDDANRYVDHIYPKHGRLQASVAAHVAQHSGDALCGVGTAGDEEFIDLVAYRVPPQVRTIVLGATYVESFTPSPTRRESGASCTCATPRSDSAQSIYDIPGLYLRLQNRTLQNPYSTELDRWNVYRDAVTAAAARDTPHKHNKKAPDMVLVEPHSPGMATCLLRWLTGQSGAPSVPARAACYVAADGTAQPVRTVLLGAMLRRGMMPFRDLFPGGDCMSANAIPGPTGVGLAATQPECVPRFEFVPIHQYAPVDPLQGFGALIPFLQFVAGCAWGRGGGTAGLRDLSAQVTVAAAAAADVGGTSLPAPQSPSQQPQAQVSQAVTSSTTPQTAALEGDGNGNKGNAAAGTTAAAADTFVLDTQHNLATWDHHNTAMMLQTAYDTSAAQPTPQAAAATSSTRRSGGATQGDNMAATGAQPLTQQYGTLWTEMQVDLAVSEPIAIEVQFIDVSGLKPRLPDRFRCHAEAWVYGRHAIPPRSATLTVASLGRAFKTPYLLHSEDTRWTVGNEGGGSSGTAGVFVVNQYDRIRLMVYEHAAFGYADLDLAQLGHLWRRAADGNGEDEERDDYNYLRGQHYRDHGNIEGNTGRHQHGTPRQARYNGMEHTLPLQGGQEDGVAGGCVRVRVSRVPFRVAVQRLSWQVRSAEATRRTVARRRQAREEAMHNASFSRCSVM